METADLKPRLREYIERSGIDLDTRKKPPILRCPSPNHTDENPSARLYDENVFCPVCSKSWDIFDIAGFINGKDKFPDKVKAVCETLGLDPPKSKKEKKIHKPVKVSIDQAKKIFDREKLSEIGKRNGWGDKAVRLWPYFIDNDNIILADVRFETPGGRKSVISVFYDGKDLRFSGAPIVIYNQHLAKLEKKKPILIVEGAKSAEAANALYDFVAVTWNGGGKKAKFANWKKFETRDVYIYPDDDQKKDGQTGELKEWYEQAGFQAALEIKRQLPQAKICQPVEAAREIKQDGADIVEALQVLTPEELTEYIKNGPQKRLLDGTDPGDVNFKILGVGETGRAYYLGRNERLIEVNLTSVTRNHALNIAPIHYWREAFSSDQAKTKISWDHVFDFLIDSAGKIDFDLSRVRGRGAWREPDGRLCYHDGETTIGEYSDHRLYLRRPKKDLGILDKPIDPEIADQIVKTIFDMSFETQSDAIRLLSWSVLAPFAGALPWRPAGLLTGPSGSGKSTVLSLLVEPVSLPEAFSGGATSEPGVRQRVQNDATAIVIEEAEEDTPKKRQFREDLFSLMRQSTSDNAPKAAKGTADGQGQFFSMRSMFLFIAISPEVEAVADDNRIFRINMIDPVNEFSPIRDKIVTLLTDKNCRAIRAKTWRHLKTIIRLAERLAPMIQDHTGKDLRFGFSEGILLAAYWIVWKDLLELSRDEMKGLIEVFYAFQPVEPKRDETAEVLDRLLDERVQVEKPERQFITIREILIALREHELEPAPDQPYGRSLVADDLAHLRDIAARYGVAILQDNSIAIANNHHEIQRILGKGKGYQRQLYRHKGLIEKSRLVRIAGKLRRCVIIGNVLEIREKPEEKEEEKNGY